MIILITASLVLIGLAVVSLIWQMRVVRPAPFWTAFQTTFAMLLHHPHPESQPLDRLLEKLEAMTLTLPDREELKSLLLEKQNNPRETELERNRAKLLLVAMEQVLRERSGGKQ